MRVFKTKWFARFAKRAGIDDQTLESAIQSAIQRAEKGIIDADLGANVIKLRVSRSGEGRSKGYRTIIAYKYRDRAIFFYGFAKNEKANIAQEELETLKDIAKEWLKAKETKIISSLDEGLLQEVNYEKEN